MQRTWIRYLTAPDGGDGDSGGPASQSNNDGGQDSGNGAPAQTFTQSDVDRIVKERVQRERSKYSDYDDLKSKAEGAKTLEDRLADLETTSTQAQQRAMRAEIAGEFGISTKRGAKGEPSDADLFLTGSDEDTLRAQAQRLVQREADRKRHGNVAQNEGDNPQPPDDPKRSFLRGLTGPN